MAGSPHPAPASMDVDDVVQRVLAGETELYAEIVRRHQQDVWRVAAALLADRAATEALVHHCFVQAYERLEQYQRGRDLGQWLKGIARNLVREELRRSSREAVRLVHYRQYLLALHDDADEVERQEQRRRAALARCRESLAPAAARALALRYEEGLSLDDVAAALGRTVAATRQLLFRARELLRACVEGRLAAE